MATALSAALTPIEKSVKKKPSISPGNKRRLNAAKLISTAMTLMRAHQNIGKQPVILCSPRIRLPLFQLLERHIPTIVVISYSELNTFTSA